ncbi:hypothetical protein BCF33_1741 [Hasllibacter halocynthiae]|uniref:Uncharacterized protein n=1 Tax=Hasllibacter halocynthiae TaxID=595589 RepID=A0A2T0X1R2_9RHOB|nr:hypothetical protein [Hasllibacter halocynthiae]PRY92878.1 hypothetical protein BCF33_1741 [Hasllibacter halocynthiae]
MRPSPPFPLAVPLAAALAVLPAALPAQEGPPGRSLGVTLDGLADVGDGCRATFVARNGTGADIDALVFEGVAFGAEGGVALLTLLDFGSLPAGRPRVRQFDLAGLGCDAIGGFLLNGIERCEGDGLGPDACLDALAVASRGDVGLEG